MAKIPLKIITPNGLFWDKEVDIVTVKTTEGYMGILHGKSPVVAALDIAELQINKHGSSDFKECAIAGGLMYASPDKVEIITDAIEEKEKINLTRAEAAKKRAQAELKQKLSDAEHKLAENALQRAINRIGVRNT